MPFLPCACDLLPVSMALIAEATVTLQLAAAHSGNVLGNLLHHSRGQGAKDKGAISMEKLCREGGKQDRGVRA